MARSECEAVLGFGLSDEQWDCVRAPLEPYVIVAGAGTGKTTVMAARVLWLVASGLVEPEAVLGLTFTNKAAAELEARIRGLLERWAARSAGCGPAPRGADCGDPTVSTYHAFAGNLLTEYGLRVGVEPGARLLDQAAVAQLAYRIVCGAEGLRAEHPGPAALASQVMRLDSELAEQALSVAELRHFDSELLAQVKALPRTTAEVRRMAQVASRRLELCDLVEVLRHEKAARGVDFPDYMRLGVELSGLSDGVIDNLRQRWQVVLLDEYQDTSIAQRLILSNLFQGRPVTAVGDPLQAIYGWRSASVANIEAFPAHFASDPEAPAAVRVLSQNRRSGTAILQAANRISTRLRSSHQVVPPLVAPAPRGAVVRAALLPTYIDERTWVAEQVAQTVRSGRDPGEIGVLCRVGADLAPLAEAISARGIPVAVHGADTLDSDPVVAEVLRTLEVLADPTANSAVVGLLSGPRWRIGPRDLTLLNQRARSLAQPAGTHAGPQSAAPARMGAPAGAAAAADGVSGPGAFTSAPSPPDASGAHAPAGGSAQLAGLLGRQDPNRQWPPQAGPGVPSLLEAVLNPGPPGQWQYSESARVRFDALASEYQNLAAAVGEPLPEVLDLVISQIGADVESAIARAVGGATGAPDPLAQLRGMVAGFLDSDGRSSLGAFIAATRTAAALGTPLTLESTPPPGRVQLMTVHKAKGLEWPVVMLPHLATGLFPSAKASPRWPSRAEVVPGELRDDRHVLPRLGVLTQQELDRFKSECRESDLRAEDRLAYVAATRARDLLVASGHWWGPATRPRGPADYLLAVREQAAEHGAADPWAPPPAAEDGQQPQNPLLAHREEFPWPSHAATGAARGGLPQRGHTPGGTTGAKSASSVAAALAELDRDIEIVLSGAQSRGRMEQPVVVETLAATQLQSMIADPSEFQRDLRRPMPRPVTVQSRRGSAFHSWVQTRLGQLPLIAEDDLPGAADLVTPDPELAKLQEGFERSDYAAMTPCAVELPFALVLAGRLVRGRIDAVFEHPGPDGTTSWEVVDWKTSVSGEADPLQLSVYRLAWARLQGVDPEAVTASYVYVRSGRVAHPQLLSEADLGELIARSGGPQSGGWESGVWEVADQGAVVTDR